MCFEASMWHCFVVGIAGAKARQVSMLMKRGFKFRKGIVTARFWMDGVQLEVALRNWVRYSPWQRSSQCLVDVVVANTQGLGVGCGAVQIAQDEHI